MCKRFFCACQCRFLAVSALTAVLRRGSNKVGPLFLNPTRIEEEGIKEFYKSSTLQGRIGNVSPLVKVPQLFLPKRFFVVVVVVVSRTNFPLEEKEKKRLFCFFHRKEKKEDGSIPSSAFFG